MKQFFYNVWKLYFPYWNQIYKMSAENEYNCAIDLINEFFVKTRDNMLMSQYEAQSLERRIQNHLEKMVSIVCGVECKKMGMRIPLFTNELSVQEE